MATATAPDTLTRPSVDPEEVEKFSRMAADWWDPDSKFKPLHKFNPVRLGFIRDTICEHFGLSGATPFKGLRILDIGCGGGLVCEPMARLGAQVTGVDAAEANVKTASVHADEQGLKIDYRHGVAEQLLEAGEPPFDVVLNLEVMEHVADPHAFLVDCTRLVKPRPLPWRLSARNGSWAGCRAARTVLPNWSGPPKSAPHCAKAAWKCANRWVCSTTRSTTSFRWARILQSITWRLHRNPPEIKALEIAER
jgi:SAM-dependent methyltransferase